ncbi:MAG: hypothetical protein ACFB15_02885 [Cyclobacteriaceae bacterium]
MDTESKLEQEKSNQRFWLSIVIVSISLIGLGVISWYILSPAKDNTISQETVFTTIVSLVGTWIGTLLAFYFSRDSYESASRNTQELVKQITTTQQKLRSLRAEDKMYQLSQISYLKIKSGEEDKYILKDLLADEKDLKKYNRLPVLTEELHPKYMVHKSLITDYLLTKQPQSPTPSQSTTSPSSSSQGGTGSATTASGSTASDPTLENLINDQKFGEQAKKSFAVVKTSDSLETAKLMMERTTTDTVLCSDVFVTENGRITSPVLGWITNVLINENSTVD